jgi:hypothetical protein
MENEDNKTMLIFFTLNGGRAMTTSQICLSSLTTDSVKNRVYCVGTA